MMSKSKAMRSQSTVTVTVRGLGAGAAFLAFLVGTLGCSGQADAQHTGQGTPSKAAVPARTYHKPSREEIARMLTPLQLDVTLNQGTEPPFRNEFWDNHEAGIYVDVVTGEPLFSSLDKFDSGTGWPSFTRPIEPGRVTTAADASDGMDRTEVRSHVGNLHLGHVFDDGPKPTGLRYCMNSAALRFVPAARLQAEGYGAYAAAFQPHEVAVLAGGCFWGMENVLRNAPGVIGVEVGYAGGSSPKVTYEDVSGGNTGHAEAVRIVFDPTQLRYEDLLLHWFFRAHDPTTKDRQGNDVGSQYRSEIFATSEAQLRTAAEVKARVEKSGKWGKPIVTEIAPATTFVRAEDEHQDYLVKHPDGYNDHFLRPFDF